MAGRFEEREKRSASIACSVDGCAELVEVVEAAAQPVAKSDRERKRSSGLRELVVVDPIGYWPRDTPLSVDDAES